jgi:hypothetical protein
MMQQVQVGHDIQSMKTLYFFPAITREGGELVYYIQALREGFEKKEEFIYGKIFILQK